MEKKETVTNQTVLEILKNKGSVSNISLFVQIILVIVLLFLFLMSVFLPMLDLTIEAILAFLLFVTAYNNHTIFKRKYFTAIYLIMGILVIGATIFSVVYGV